MFRNYFITAYRNLLRNKVYALLNIAGLALGIGCALVIYKVIDYELGFDTFRDDKDKIYRIVSYSQLPEGIEYDSGVPFPMSEGVRNDFAEVEKTAAITAWDGLLVTLENGDKFSVETGVGFAEAEFLEMFGFKVIHGKRTDYLTNPEEALISESLAKKYFNYDGINPDDVIGQQLIFDNSLTQTISGIFEDQPEQTDFPFVLFAPYKQQQTLNPFYDDGKEWGMTMSSNHCYILVPGETDIQRLEASFDPFLKKYLDTEAYERTTSELIPLSEEHFNTQYSNFTGRIARKDFLTALSIIGLFLIITGAVNFVNMATAQSVVRSKEIGIRKVLGGQRNHLIVQILSETFIITFLALLISLGLAELFFINLRDILGYRLNLDLLGSWEMIPILIVTLLSVTFLSGLYPSILLSKSSPITAMKTKVIGGRVGGGINVRRGLVILQFTITQFLIFATLAINSQMSYFQDAPLGFDKENIITFDLPENDPETLELLKNQLLSNPMIEKVSFGLGGPIAESNATTGFKYPKSGSDDKYMSNFKPVDEDFIDLFGLEVIAGRGLIKGADSLIVINETMVEKMKLENPDDAVGERVHAWGNRTIGGVVKDFHTYSLHKEKIPTILFKMPQYYYQGQVKIAGNNYTNLSEAISFVDEKWTEAFPKYLFDYSIMDEFINDRYSAEKRVSQLYQIFSVLAIFIGCLGLYGLISFIANQKTKEIGIRKVLGATISSILRIFTKELVILLIIAFTIGTPVAYYIINDWLNDFHYRIDIDLTLFILALAVTFTIALVTMGYNSLRAAYANPVDSLRDE